MLIEELFITEGQWHSGRTVLIDHGADCGADYTRVQKCLISVSSTLRTAHVSAIRFDFSPQTEMLN
jgi:hypothetical protein